MMDASGFFLGGEWGYACHIVVDSHEDEYRTSETRSLAVDFLSSFYSSTKEMSFTTANLDADKTYIIYRN